MFVTTRDGYAIKVRELRGGSGSSREATVLLVHALGMDGSMWQRVAKALSAPASVFAIDCRGHGLSDKPRGPYAIESFARDVADVADALGLERFVLGGCSMGGTVAQDFSGMWPQRLQGLLLVDTTPWYGPDAATNWLPRAEKALAEGLGVMVPFQRERWFSPSFASANPEVVAEAVAVFLRNDPRAYADTCRMLAEADVRDRVRRYEGPATVVVGEEDYATPPASARSLAALLDARLVVIPGARHFTPYQSPEVLAGELDSLVRTT